MAQSWPPKKNTALSFEVGLFSQADPTTLKSAPTLAAGDFKISIDGAAPVNITNTPTASGTVVTIALTAAEMNGDRIHVVWVDAAGAEWIASFADLWTAGATFDELTARIPAALTSGGRMKASLEAILDTAFTEGAAGRIANAFKTFLNIAVPTLTVADVNQTGDAYGIVSDATVGNTAISNRIPAALVSGRMVSHVAAFAAAVIDSGAFASSATASIADAVWNRNPKGGADGVAGTSRAGDAVASGFMFFAIDGAGNLVVKHTDGTQASARAIGRFATAMNAIQTGT